jgi:hypothetical protein
MTPWRAIFVVVVCLWFAGWLQQSLAHRLVILGARPDFLLAFLAPLCLLMHRVGGALTGFLAGLIQGAIAGANMTHYIVSRTLTGFIISWSRGLEYEVSLLLAGLIGALTTLLAQSLLMFLAPPPEIFPFMGATIRTAVYNGVLAMPIYAVLKRVLHPAPI